MILYIPTILRIIALVVMAFALFQCEGGLVPA